MPQGWRQDLPSTLAPREQFSRMKKVLTEIEQLGFDSAWLYDHFHTVPQPTTGSCFESWTLLSTFASLTEQIRLGHTVLCNSYRHPAVLAKMAATFDVISNGRLEFGVGAGWYEQEYTAYGIPFPKPSVRIGMLREAVQIIKKMWTEEKATFHGKYYSIQEAINSPKPLQKPHPPILIGGGGEQLTLKVVARFADKCNFGTSLTFEEYARKYQILEGYCRAIGRNPAEIEKTCNRGIIVAKTEKDVRERVHRFQRPPPGHAFYVAGTPEQCIGELQRYKDLGVTYFILYFPDAAEIESLKLFAEKVIPALR